MKRIVVMGASGFIGHHLANRLAQDEENSVVGVDCAPQNHSFTYSEKWRFVLADLRQYQEVWGVIPYDVDEVYQLAADMGGAGYIFTGEHDAEITCNNALVNCNIARVCRKKGARKVFFSSSACVYPLHNQLDPAGRPCTEDSVYPAAPDSEYGWEKIFSERMWRAMARNHGLDVRIARYHNIYGPECAWNDGREKAPAALCRKVALSDGEVEVWGDGYQTRSFLYIDDCLDATLCLMEVAGYHNDPDIAPPIVNIGSEWMVAIDNMVRMIAAIAGKEVVINHVKGPQGVRGRCSDNTLMEKVTGWHEQVNLYEGLEQLYKWVNQQVKKNKFIGG